MAPAFGGHYGGVVIATVTVGNTTVHICVLWEERFSIIAWLDKERRERGKGGKEREREGRIERERSGMDVHV